MNSNADFLGRAILLLGTGIACGSIGYFSGHHSTPASNVPQEKIVQITATDVIKPAAETAAAPSQSLTTRKTGWNDLDWKQLSAQPATPLRNSTLAALLEQLAATDPDQAMAVAKAEANLKFRETLIESVLHGWARTAPLDAAKWVLASPETGVRDAQLSAAFAGAVATSPDSAVAMGKTLIQQNSGDAVGLGARLIDALCDSGNFSAAANLATSGDASQRNFWLGEAFSKWASFQPEAAARAAQDITDPAVRNQALHGIVGGWSESDPASLVQFLSQLPQGGDRGAMLGQALKCWVQKDPAAAANWMNANNQFDADLNQGAAQVAMTESLAPKVALAWAESISDQQLKSSTLASVLRDWVYEDLPAAENYFQNTKDLLPADRQQLAQVIDDMNRIMPQ